MTDYARFMAQQASERREAEIIAGLEGEVERLREALHQIRDWAVTLGDATRIAADALASTERTGESS